MSSIDQLAVNAIRALSIDMVQKANSGHPGIALGAAPLAYAIWAKSMKHNPADPGWENRDRFVLSAGHGSSMLYAMLHLFGYGLTLEDLKNFRQLGSLTPGHPEYGHTVGVETTTGPLGQGVANAVGFAMAEAHLAALYNRPGYPVVDHYTYALCGDGCMMEGISGEASSLAGTLKLGKLILVYDSNRITIEGDTDGAFTEDVAARYRGYGWQVLEVAEGNCVEAISAALEQARANTQQPSLVIVKTHIGHGSPKADSASSHGEALGAENVKLTKQAMDWPLEPDFSVPDAVYKAMESFRAAAETGEASWKALFAQYRTAYPELAEAYEAAMRGEMPDFGADPAFWQFKGPDATRGASGAALNRMAERAPSLFFGGSADLGPTNKSEMKNAGYFSAEHHEGNNIHFGVREHAMAAICNAIALHGGLHAYAATFLVFSDYMKHSMRLAAMMKLPVTYILTHDSIGVGEDGPTHEPIEQLAMLRSIPNMTVYRTAVSVEPAAAWLYSLKNDGPTALILSRQNLPLYAGEAGRGAAQGAYILSEAEGGAPEVLLLATGSEVELAMKAQEALKQQGVRARVVSMPSWEVFEKQSEDYKQSVLPDTVRARLAIEAAGRFGWDRYIGLDGDIVCMPGYGASGPAAKVFEHFGFTVENVVEHALSLLRAGK